MMEQAKVVLSMVKVTNFLLQCDKKVTEHYAKYNKRIHTTDNKIIVSFGDYNIIFFDEGEDLYTIYLHGYEKQYRHIMSESKSEKNHFLWFSDIKFNYCAIKGENKVYVKLNGMLKETSVSSYNEDGTPGAIENFQDLKKFSKSVDKELCEELLLSK